MTIYQQVLYSWLAGGVVVALALLVVGVLRFRRWGQLVCVALAVLGLWFGLAAGVSHGYLAWQTSPNPPDEAFADGAKLTGSVLFGWMPAGLFCVVCWVLLRLCCKLLRRPPVPAR